MNIIKDIQAYIDKNNAEVNTKDDLLKMFNKVYDNIIKYSFSGDYSKFIKEIDNLSKTNIIYNYSEEDKHLFIIKYLLTEIFGYELCENNFFYNSNHPLSDYFEIKVTWQCFIPTINIIPNKERFTKDFNNYIDSEIYIDENDNIKLKCSINDKNIDYDKLNNLKFGNYLKEFTETYYSLIKLIEKTEKQINNER